MIVTGIIVIVFVILAKRAGKDVFHWAVVGGGVYNIALASTTKLSIFFVTGSVDEPIKAEILNAILTFTVCASLLVTWGVAWKYLLKTTHGKEAPKKEEIPEEDSSTTE